LAVFTQHLDYAVLRKIEVLGKNSLIGILSFGGAVSDNRNCLTLSSLWVHHISHKPIKPTGITPLKNPMGLL